MKLLKKFDILILSLIVIVCICVMLIPKQKSNTAEVYVYNKLVKVYDLTDGEEDILVIEGVIIKKTKLGELYFDSSDCPDQVCVQTGKISKDGQSAACLPNGVVIYLSTNEFDKII